ncbi:MAG: vanadium-dependent haloperoxidase [Gammaproteobacteria bacterium]|nr:vanadium-dependent haloperoxidase [Gammaproteobacteria bacterium]
MNSRTPVRGPAARASLTLTAWLAGLTACGLMSIAAPVQADAVTDWNEITVASAAAGRSCPVCALDIALVQLAVHDAVQAIEQRFEPYHVEVKGAKGSRSAAVAAAAHDVLVGMYPAQAASLDATYYTYLADKGLSGDPGIVVGQKVAAGILPLRRATPDPLPAPYVGGTEPGMWRPTPSYLGNPPAPAPFSPMVAPWLASTDPFTLTGPARFRAPAPPAMTSERYRRDFEEVKAVGAFASSTRTAEQTDLAHFYNDNVFAQWNRAMRAIAARHLHNIGDTARLFALANVATADALITAWESKKHYTFWRPLTAIHEADQDGNPHTAADPAWRSLINNPNYPDYSSGYNVVTAAMTGTLALYFGRDRMDFEVTSNSPLAVQKTRSYSRFSAAAQDVVDARVYLGIHFRFADTAARTQGREVARWTFNHFLLPCDGHGYHAQSEGAQ